MSQGTPTDRLVELGLILPRIAGPIANYRPYVIHGELLYISGQLPFSPDGSLPTGHVGREVSVAQGQFIAKQCALNILAQIEAAVGSLDRVERVIKLTVFVASAPGFTEQSAVGNGASDLMAKVFGEAGRHARSAIGVAELPRGVPVEVEAIVAVRGGAE